MKKLRIYLDTSVINFLFAEDAPDFRAVTAVNLREGYRHPLRIVSPRRVAHTM